jgi:hypothetical protein
MAGQPSQPTKHHTVSRQGLRNTTRPQAFEASYRLREQPVFLDGIDSKAESCKQLQPDQAELQLYAVLSVCPACSYNRTWLSMGREYER